VKSNLVPLVQPGRAALLVIDVQKDFVKPPMQPMVDALATLLAKARAAGVFVVYVQNFVMKNGMTHTPAEILRRGNVGLAMEVTVDGTQGQDFVDDIAPQPNDPVIRKLRLDSFYGTNLETLLRARKIETVLITGVATHGCVTGTSYAAQARDFHVIVVKDCVATWSDELHQSALRVLEGTMAGVVDSVTLAGAWSQQRQRANA
jgi:ureidoacrylate peracid hydrolase